MTQQTTRNTEESFQHYFADEIKTELNHVSGWVPAQNVEPLLEEVPEATVQYYTEDKMEAFVTTL